MNTQIQTLFTYCKEKKEEAKKLTDASHPRTRYDASQAVYAWTELVECLSKPNNLTPKRFQASKEMALRMANLMTSGSLKDSTKLEIMSLEL